ncbi:MULTISPECIES: 23S rRNA (adenine(1618)-N(6))-methyltransferase RlmF [Flectobacillus]|uniref:23S rRNA (adenine(1618)-N(6))-methyltransferase RlmF n=1 Tax=Flectobacillus TaxID=101 RepID=UPI000BA43F94|nr:MULTISPECIES: 23S rRNA (adenine(1618)-N(6))-methyltransferase RlmF [Flectobacillus]MDI9868231.1 23S rRNA (adenine(1618)-N(6))-methyltransferase RlmF [Flectobacillus roseus]PAC33203.1 23S rRNA (adenine(1618)-N(6))-methyltransferase [Flectobacillus sp. BAB-3569]
MLHSRNKHQERYDMEALMKVSPELKPFVFINQYGSQTIDFANPAAVKLLNKAILKAFYKIDYWDIPLHYLCPPIPGRADYLHYTADLLAEANNGQIPMGKDIKILDVGVGANCVYPIIGHAEYGWRFVGSEVDKTAMKSAQNIVITNQNLKNNVDVRLQNRPDQILEGIIRMQELFDLVICNPPFHASAEEASASSIRKQQNLTGKKVQNASLNFGGQSRELWCDGGELKFIWQMIQESKVFAKNCLWFSSLVSKKDNLKSLYKALDKTDVTNYHIIEMSHGQKISRILVWTYFSEEERKTWAKARFGNK